MSKLSEWLNRKAGLPEINLRDLAAAIERGDLLGVLAALPPELRGKLLELLRDKGVRL